VLHALQCAGDAVKSHVLVLRLPPVVRNGLGDSIKADARSLAGGRLAAEDPGALGDVDV
jgi:hypothetical protein